MSGESIRKLRERLGLTQAELAARIGVSWRSVARWEAGDSTPSPLARAQLEKLKPSRKGPKTRRP